jgi:small subunit ribosomal protein S18
MSTKKPQRPTRSKEGGRKDNGRKPKKKVSILAAEKVEYVDYKDVNLLQRFVSDRSKIRSRRVSGNTVQQQREIATAIKNAREMALMPYLKRVSTQRSSRPSPAAEAVAAAEAANAVEAVPAAAAAAEELETVAVDGGED